jgi:hypothetical protein
MLLPYCLSMCMVITSYAVQLGHGLPTMTNSMDNPLEEIHKLFKPIADIFLRKSGNLMDKMSQMMEEKPQMKEVMSSHISPQSSPKPLMRVRVYKIDRQINPHTHATRKVIVQRMESGSPMGSSGLFESEFPKPFMKESDSLGHMMRSMEEEMNKFKEQPFPFHSMDDKFRMPHIPGFSHEPSFKKFSDIISDMNEEKHEDRKWTMDKQTFHFPSMRSGHFAVVPGVTLQTFGQSGAPDGNIQTLIRTM